MECGTAAGEQPSTRTVITGAPLGNAIDTAPRADTDISNIRVLVVHEWLYDWAGAERCLEQILEVIPQADLLVGIITADMRDANTITRRAQESWVGRIPGARSNHRWFLPLHAAAFAAHDTSHYDLVISSSHAFEKFIRARHGGTHLCYCYSPPRFLWDMRHVYAEQSSTLERAALAIAGAPFRALDRRAARGVDRFISISRYVAERVRRSYGVESRVIYPPVDMKRAAPSIRREVQPYLLFMGRLVEYKRVDLVIQAAERLRMKLIVAGDGPQRRKLEQLAGPYTVFRGKVSEADSAALLSDCAAFVFAGEEDFGISLLEANAHGRPVVCFNRGGAAETMIEGQTAVMFDRQDVNSIVTSIESALSHPWDAASLRRNAERFSSARFRSEFRSAVADALHLPRQVSAA